MIRRAVVAVVCVCIILECAVLPGCKKGAPKKSVWPTQPWQTKLDWAVYNGSNVKESEIESWTTYATGILQDDADPKGNLDVSVNVTLSMGKVKTGMVCATNNCPCGGTGVPKGQDQLRHMLIRHVKQQYFCEAGIVIDMYDDKGNQATGWCEGYGLPGILLNATGIAAQPEKEIGGLALAHERGHSSGLLDLVSKSSEDPVSHRIMGQPHWPSADRVITNCPINGDEKAHYEYVPSSTP